MADGHTIARSSALKTHHRTPAVAPEVEYTARDRRRIAERKGMVAALKQRREPVGIFTLASEHLHFGPILGGHRRGAQQGWQKGD